MIVTCPACGRKAAVEEDAREVACDCGRRFDPTVRPTVGDPFLGRTFDGYRIEGLLGTGGMGTVYRASQQSLARTVAIKVLPPNVADDPQFVARFHREAEILASLSHPNIVQVIDRGEIAGRYYIVMEYVDGTNLRELVRGTPMPPKEAYRIVAALLGALDYAHARRVIHRDIKPENVLVSRTGVVKVADFGVSRVLGADGLDTRLTRTHLVLGTYEYMSPEQRESVQDADARSDIYATAVVLYEMLTGELPIGRFDLPSRQVSGLDRRIDRIVARALAKDPARRYARASAMAHELETLISAPAGAPVDLVAIRDYAEKFGAQVRDGLEQARDELRKVRPAVDRARAEIRKAVAKTGIGPKPPKTPVSFEVRLDVLLTVLTVLGGLVVVLGVGFQMAGEDFELGLVRMNRDYGGIVMIVYGVLLMVNADRTRKFKQSGRSMLLTLTALSLPTVVGLVFMAWTWFVLLNPSMRIYFDARFRGFDTFEAARLAHGIPLDPHPRPEVERRRNAVVKANQRAALIVGAAALVAGIAWLAVVADSPAFALRDEGAFLLGCVVALFPVAGCFALLGERIRHGEWIRLNARLWTLLTPLAPRAAQRARMLARDARDGAL